MVKVRIAMGLVLATLLPGLVRAQTLDGVSVHSIWHATNFLNEDWLSGEPAFTQSGEAYVASMESGFRHAVSDEPLGMVMHWDIRRISNAPPVLSQLSVPPSASFVVIGEFTLQGQTVRTYATAEVESGRLTGRHLGYMETSGTIVADSNPPGAIVFSGLGINGPFVNRIVVDADE